MPPNATMNANLPAGLDDLADELTVKERAIVVHVLLHPGQSHEDIAESLGCARTTITRALRREHVRAALVECYSRAVFVVRSEAERNFLSAFNRIMEIFEPGNGASNSDVIRAFAQLREILDGQQQSPADPGESHKPRGVIVIPYECPHCGNMPGEHDSDPDA